jgi:hypothetical protein
LLNGILGPDGATVQVEVSVGRTVRRALLAAHRPIPQPITVTALIDTGADVSCIDSDALGQLNLQQRRAFLLVNAPGLAGLPYQPAYFAALTVLHPSGQPSDNLVIRDILLASLPLHMPGCQLLFGRDALANCRFDFDGPAMAFALEY